MKLDPKLNTKPKEANAQSRKQHSFTDTWRVFYKYTYFKPVNNILRQFITNTSTDVVY